MLDKRKIRIMSRMAIYDKNNISKDLKISTYYKHDYASLNTWINVIWATVGYVIIFAFYVLCNINSIMSGLTIEKLIRLGIMAGAGYIVMLIFYCVASSLFYRTIHNQAKHRVKKYYKDLNRLELLNAKERRK